MGQPDARGDSLWDISEVAAFLSVSVRSARRYVNRPDFPRRIELGARTHRWVASQVRKWALAQQRPTPAAFDALR